MDRDGYDDLDACVDGRGGQLSLGSPGCRCSAADGQRVLSAVAYNAGADRRLGIGPRQQSSSFPEERQRRGRSRTPLTASLTRDRDWNGDHDDGYTARGQGHQASGPQRGLPVVCDSGWWLVCRSQSVQDIHATLPAISQVNTVPVGSHRFVGGLT